MSAYEPYWLALFVAKNNGFLSVNKALVSAEFRSLTVPKMENNPFSGCQTQFNIYVPDAVIDDYKNYVKHLNEIIKRVDLVGKEDKFPNELSGGMRQRVSLIRTLATIPKILLPR